MKRALGRAIIEVAFILFLFYANLLMGEFTHSGAGRVHGLTWAIADIFTGINFAIGTAAGLLGYLGFELLRKAL